MSDYQCAASIEGVCHNVYGYGTKCNGYSEDCKLRPHYENVTNIAKGVASSVKNMFGIKGDRE